MTITYTDRIFWLRVSLGFVVGASSQVLFDTDYTSGILLAITVYLASYYLVKQVWGGKLKPEDSRKLITAGLGSYALFFLFFWILLFTLGVHYLRL
jgi:hypothetical protein